jgi:hypothetical protein
MRLINIGLVNELDVKVDGFLESHIGSEFSGS